MQPTNKTTDKYAVEVIAILRGAREKVAQPYGWTRGAYHRPDPRSPRGVANCLVGAVTAAARDLNLPLDASRQLIRDSEERLAKELNTDHPGLLSFNDDTANNKRRVLTLIDRAIATAEKELS